MFKYNNTHIFTGYLKQLLSSVNIPACRIYTREFADYLKKYGKEDPRIIESIDSVIYGAENKRLTTRINYLKNNEIYNYFWPQETFLKDNDTELGHKKAKWKKTSNVCYDSDKTIHGLTKTLSSPGIYYDRVTHEYLGDYLRFLRDYHDINLMSLYNCFNNHICSNLYISVPIAGKNIIFDSRDANYKIYAFPVKLFEDYTIALDSYQGIEMFCGFYNTKLDASNKSIELITKTYKKVNGTLFNQPFLYDKLNVKYWTYLNDLEKIDSGNNVQIKTKNITRWDIANREQDLKMFIKVPISSKSSIVVLEGDFRNSNSSKFSIINKKNLFMDNCTVGSKITELGKKPENLFDYKTANCDVFYKTPNPVSVPGNMGVIVPSIEYYDATQLSEGNIPIWDGTTVKPKYSEKNGYCEISNGAELAYIIKNGGLVTVGDKEIRKYKLVNDIFLNDPTKIRWTNSDDEQYKGYNAGAVVDSNYTIRYWFSNNDIADNNAFYGTIDGDFHTVHGLYVDDNNAAGLIPKLNTDKLTSIINLGINHSYLSGYTASAFIGGTYSSNSKNVPTSWQYEQNSKIINFGNNQDKNKIDINARGFKPISRLQLLEFNTGESYPFADRLVEYLGGNAITPIDQIYDNIKRTQRVMNLNKHYFEIEGIWEDKMQKIIYDYIMNSGPVELTKDGSLRDAHRGYHAPIGHVSKSCLFDVLGYVDKDAEKWYASWGTDGKKAIVKDSIQSIDIYNNLYNI